MPRITGRFADVVIGIGMLIGAVVLQAIFLTLFALAILGLLSLAHVRTSDLVATTVFIAVIVGANVASFVSYRRRLAAYGYDPEDAKIVGIGGPKTTSVTNVTYLVPRAIARIFVGSERLFTPIPPAPPPI